MSYEVIPLQPFAKQLKRLARKFPSLAELAERLTKEPAMGTALGRNCYKIRLSIASKGGGKSGGGRVITCVRVVRERVYLLSIFDKSEKDTLTDKEITQLLKLIGSE